MVGSWQRKRLPGILGAQIKQRLKKIQSAVYESNLYISENENNNLNSDILIYDLPKANKV